MLFQNYCSLWCLVPKHSRYNHTADFVVHFSLCLYVYCTLVLCHAYVCGVSVYTVHSFEEMPNSRQ